MLIVSFRVRHVHAVRQSQYLVQLLPLYSRDPVLARQIWIPPGVYAPLQRIRRIQNHSVCRCPPVYRTARFLGIEPDLLVKIFLPQSTA